MGATPPVFRARTAEMTDPVEQPLDGIAENTHPPTYRRTTDVQS